MLGTLFLLICLKSQNRAIYSYLIDNPPRFDFFGKKIRGGLYLTNAEFSQFHEVKCAIFLL